MAEYKRLDLAKLKFSDHALSFDEALENVVQMVFTDDMFDENGMLKVKSVKKDEANRRVLFEF